MLHCKSADREDLRLNKQESFYYIRTSDSQKDRGVDGRTFIHYLRNPTVRTERQIHGEEMKKQSLEKNQLLVT